jgi:hypothetical protein
MNKSGFYDETNKHFLCTILEINTFYRISAARFTFSLIPLTAEGNKL